MKPKRLSKAERRSLSLPITALGQHGEGLAILDGKRIYVPDVLPGETVRATLTDQIDRDVFRATAEAIEIPSATRVPAPCPYYDSCGGCALQHMEQQAYRAWKADQVRAALSRGGINPLRWDEPIFIPQTTRRRATFAVLKQGSRLVAGFHGRRSHQIASIDACLLIRPGIMRALDQAKPWLLKILKEGKAASLFVQEVGGEIEAVLTGPLVADNGDLHIRETFAGWSAAAGMSRISWRREDRHEPEIMIQAHRLLATFGALTVDLPPGAFLQPSREGEAALVGTVLAFLEETGHKPEKTIADLFAGCGTFTGPLLDYGPVMAVESDAAPVDALRAARGSHKLMVDKRDLFTQPLRKPDLAKVDVVVIDPPRAGARAQAAELAASDVPAVISVSCNPVSFAKDAATLLGGGFKLQRVRVVDQFIWSAHAELAGLFTRA
jgi:23S rRNA (uracil1939-C5)-methyltransferase